MVNKALAIRPARQTFRVNGDNVLLIDNRNPYTHSGYAIRWSMGSGHYPCRVVPVKERDTQMVFEVFDDNTVWVIGEEKLDGQT